MEYYIIPCECGRIHFLDELHIIDICNENSKVVHVCNNCGKSHMIWFEPYGDEENSVLWCGKDLHDENIDVQKENIKNIIFTPGFKVPMTTGGFATSYVNGTFLDWENEAKEGELEKDITTVDTQSLINIIRDEDKLRQLSHLALGIHWKGTKYERAYNK